MLQILSSFLSLILYLPFIYAQTDDLCGIIETVLPTGPTTVENVVQCACQNTIAEAIEANSVLAAFAAFVGELDAEVLLLGEISSIGETECIYPANAIQQCTLANVCAFTCATGTTLCSDGSCSATCPSSVLRREQLPMVTSAARCPANKEMCRFGRSLKCVDTQTNLVSCGGCMHGRPSKRGQDCSEIPGVDVVSCVGGGCDVKSCIEGYTFNPDSRSCSLTATELSS